MADKYEKAEGLTRRDDSSPWGICGISHDCPTVRLWQCSGNDSLLFLWMPGTRESAVSVEPGVE